MRESPTAVAPPYINGPTYHVERGHQRVVSFVTAAAAANAVDVWPDGNDDQSPDENPLPNVKLSGVGSVREKGSRSSGDALDEVCESLGDQHCLRAVPAEVGNARFVGDASDDVERPADDVGAGARDQLDARRRMLEQTVRLCRRVEELARRCGGRAET